MNKIKIPFIIRNRVLFGIDILAIIATYVAAFLTMGVGKEIFPTLLAFAPIISANVIIYIIKRFPY